VSGIDHFLSAAAQRLDASFWTAIGTLVWPALVFGALAALTKGGAALAWTARLISETRINLSLHFVDWVLIGPLMGIVLAAVDGVISGLGFTLIGAEPWPLSAFTPPWPRPFWQPTLPTTGLTG
jgi:hypothetical protein